MRRAGGLVVTVVEPWLGRTAGMRAPVVVGGILSFIAMALSARWLTDRGSTGRWLPR